MEKTMHQEPAARDWNSPIAYDRTVFADEFAKAFGNSPRYNAGSLPSTFALLRMIETDRQITDLRWAAYMMATTMWETTSPHRVLRQATNRKGLAIKDKHGKPVMLKTTHWQMTMAPVSEVGHGKGRKYHDPVKIKVLDDGSARITENDDDQFIITPSGKIKPLSKIAKMGSNYVQAGIALGRGLALLLNPELVKTPEIAFELMSHGMRTGKIFANGKMLDDFISGKDADYAGARSMVNGTDHSSDIAEIAKKIEAVLVKSRADGKILERATRSLP